MRGSQLFLVVVVLLASASLSAPDLSERWINFHDADGAFFQEITDNYARYGLIETRTGQYLGINPQSDLERLTVYGHFPQLLPLLLYGATKIFGNNEFALRMVMWLTTLLTASVIFAFMRYVFGWVAGIWALMFYAFSPMVVFLARLPEYEPLATGLMALVLLAYAYGLRHPTANSWQAAGLIATAAAAWVGWAIFIFSGLILLHALIWGERKHRIFAVGVCVTTALMGLLFLLHLEWVSPGGIEELYERFKYRSSTTDGDTTADATFTIVQFCLQLGPRIAIGYTPTVIILALVSVAVMSKKLVPWHHMSTRELVLPSIMLLTGLLYVLLLRQAAYLHDYLLYYFGVGLGMCGSLAVRSLWRRWYAPVARLLYILILVGFFVGAYRWIVAYREYDIVPLRYTLGEQIRRMDQPDARLASNLPSSVGTSLQYYTQSYRGIHLETPPEDFLAGEYDIYVYCSRTDPTPDWTRDFKATPTQDGFCLIVERE